MSSKPLWQAPNVIQRGLHNEAAVGSFRQLDNWIAQAPCVPASSLLKRIQIKRDNTVISAAASTPSSDEE